MLTTLGYTMPFEARVFAPLNTGAQADPIGASVATDGWARLPRLGWWQKRCAFGVRGAARVVRLLHLHRAAVMAEFQGRWAAADLLWGASNAELQRTWPDAAAWSDASKRLAASTTGPDLDGDALRLRVQREVLLEAHCGFYNAGAARDAQPGADDRAFVHGRQIVTVLELTGLGTAELAPLVTASTGAFLDALKTAGRWYEAIDACEAVLRCLPDDAAFESRLVDLHFESALSELTHGETPSEQANDSRSLREALKQMEAARRQHGHCLSFYNALAQLQRLLAIKLAHAGQLSEALEAARLARKYDPYLADAEKTEAELEALMRQLQNQIADVRHQLATQPGSTLNADGLRLAREAEQGFALQAKVDASDLARELDGAFERAHARDVWRAVGLPPPADRWDERALALRDALSAVMAARPSRAEELPGLWATLTGAETSPSPSFEPGSPEAATPGEGVAAATTPERALLLHDIDAQAALRFLRARLFDDTPERAADAPPKPIGELQSGASASGGPPLVPAPLPAWTATQRRASLEPVGYWLLSERDLGVKLLALAALVALVAVLPWGVVDLQDRDQRRDAYAALRAGVVAADDEAVMRAAEAFFSVQPAADDGREADARRHYEEAFARWFTARGHVLDEHATARVERFRALMQS